MVPPTAFAHAASTLVSPDPRAAASELPFIPLDAQSELAAVLTQHRRVVAVLPTGAGKTLGAALPFALGQLDPAQMCFMTPLRTLTSAQATTLRDRLRPEVATQHLGLPWHIAEQTGASPFDPIFEATATVTTFDQALSAALRISYSTSRRRRTINAGAVLGSYLVADEVHLFPRGEALTTLLCLLRHRPPELPFLLMTATLTPAVAHGLAELLDATVVQGPLSTADQRRLGVQTRQRRVRWQPEPLAPQQILTALQEVPARRVLVVVNTVRRAIELAQALEPLVGREHLRVLHSRFYQQDRQLHEQTVRETFGKRVTPSSLSGEVTLIIATQVVEVGLDISADMLLTELAPASALVQRWGRCARWGGSGVIVVAPPPDAGKVHPYSGRDDAEVVARTRSWLEARAATPEGLEIDDVTERVLLDAAHAAADERWLSGLQSVLTDRTRTAGETIAQGLYQRAGQLIRHVDTRTLLICDDPDTFLKYPYGMQGFSLAPGSLMPLLAGGRRTEVPQPISSDDDDEGEGELDLSFNLPAPIPWTLKRPIWPEDPAETHGERSANEVNAWREVERRSELAAEPLLAINPAIVSYDPFFGLSLDGRGAPVDPHYWAKPVPQRFVPTSSSNMPPVRQCETLAEHVANMLTLYERDPVLGPRLRRIAAVVERWCSWPSQTLDRLVRAAIVAHDGGKLSPVWQRGATTYQRMLNHPAPRWIVHTDDDGGAGIPFPRPPHALSGAAHTLPLGEALDAEIAVAAPHPDDVGALPSNVLFTAIATHHTPRLSAYLLTQSERLDGDALAELDRLLALHGLPPGAAPVAIPNLEGCGVQQAVIGDFIGERESFVLALVTRMLRLADGWSQDPFRLEQARGTASAAAAAAGAGVAGSRTENGAADA